MNRISFLFKSDPKIYLGRWNIDYCHQTLYTKVMYANEDHCGTCGSTMISRQLHTVKKDRVRELKQQTDAARRYNEYLNAAIRSRMVKKETDLEQQIQMYICMN